MSFISDRSDISDWLIHFTRDRDLRDYPDEFLTPDLSRILESDASAFSSLLSILRIGAILPGYSFRSGRTTIYGGQPAVCFTEAPVLDFIRYVESRNKSTRTSFYGVCLLKKEVFAAGGRPVIYGLSGDEPKLLKDTDIERIIEPETLPFSEQYRYVAYNPNRTRPLDWTREREWRWMPKGIAEHEVWYDSHLNGPFPGLPLFRSNSSRGYFTALGFLVWSEEEAQRIAEMLLNFADAGYNGFEEEYSPDVLQNCFAIVLSDVEELEVQRIEDLPKSLLISSKRTSANQNLIEKIKRIVEEAKVVAKRAADEYQKKHIDPEVGYIKDVCGFADVVTYAASSEVTDAFLKAGLARSWSGEGYHIDCIPLLDTKEQSISYHEAAALAAAEYLTNQLGQSFYMTSWWD